MFFQASSVSGVVCRKRTVSDVRTSPRLEIVRLVFCY